MTKEYSQFLAHHGIKGQKWGRRRFQNEDGSLTAEGEARYGIDSSREREQKHEDTENNDKIKISNTLYLKKQPGVTQDDVEKRREQVKTMMKVAAGVTVAAVLAYGGYKAYKYLSPRLDRTLKSGTQLHRLHAEAEADTFKKPFYATPNSKDAIKYRGIFGDQKLAEKEGLNRYADFFGGQKQKEAVYESLGVAKQNIRIAGDRAGRKAYEALMKNDKEFAKAITERAGKGVNPFNIAAPQDANQRDRAYKLFNQWLVDHSSKQEPLSQKFYAELKKRGYGGVVDVNDRELSGYMSKSARIIFDTDKIQRIGSVELSRKIINHNKEVAVKTIERQMKNAQYTELLEPEVKRIIYGSAATVGVAKLSLSAADAMDRSAIRQYKKDHPNTKMTDNEILKSLRKAG